MALLSAVRIKRRRSQTRKVEQRTQNWRPVKRVRDRRCVKMNHVVVGKPDGTAHALGCPPFLQCSRQKRGPPLAPLREFPDNGGHEELEQKNAETFQRVQERGHQADKSIKGKPVSCSFSRRK